MGFTAAENILPAVENKTIFKKEVEPIIVYDASSHINIGEIDQVLNESGLNFEGDNKAYYKFSFKCTKIYKETLVVSTFFKTAT